MKKIRKHKCSECGKIAQWLYLPTSKGKVFFCDNCVPRGCSCNVDNIEENGLPDMSKNILWWSKKEYEDLCQQHDYGKITMLASTHKNNDSFYYEYSDNKGRRNPCCEYEYDEDGFEIIENKYYLKFNDIIECIKRTFLHIKEDNVSAKTLKEIVTRYVKTFDDEEDIEYCAFIGGLHDVILPYKWRFCTIMKSTYDFYNSTRSVLYEKKFLKD